MRANSFLSRNRRSWRIALWLLLLLGGNALQVVAATHFHGAVVSAGSGHSLPQPINGTDDDNCLLCQVAAHAGDSAPPPAPWVLAAAAGPAAAAMQSAASVVPVRLSSHAWQGRAPPQV